ncbi:hypothetical protein RO3G_16843 [Rhizopus delemar RA 99-880]|uniref:Uncharacterized protein n=1 Tax=Rhizopus delemar (strain RA 99-880 / ATCC MYA-4621 / FGSC 9543 / NRRL 43880) TaxID=246409 RepID=I1CUK2_RHIO9|nr:hypothetical protein RO3G_16843 [Rhizopus delemar RA 99-880]|eukprot:EIE92132.1 hypothetical protein RO3G_16843 [Rhizopus delemar RA 99-880]
MIVCRIIAAVPVAFIVVTDTVHSTALVIVMIIATRTTDTLVIILLMIVDISRWRAIGC